MKQETYQGLWTLQLNVWWWDKNYITHQQTTRQNQKQDRDVQPLKIVWWQDEQGFNTYDTSKLYDGETSNVSRLMNPPVSYDNETETLLGTNRQPQRPNEPWKKSNKLNRQPIVHKSNIWPPMEWYNGRRMNISMTAEKRLNKKIKKEKFYYAPTNNGKNKINLPTSTLNEWMTQDPKIQKTNNYDVQQTNDDKNIYTPIRY